MKENRKTTVCALACGCDSSLFFSHLITRTAYTCIYKLFCYTFIFYILYSLYSNVGKLSNRNPDEEGALHLVSFGGLRKLRSQRTSQLQNDFQKGFPPIVFEVLSRNSKSLNELSRALASLRVCFFQNAPRHIGVNVTTF